MKNRSIHSRQEMTWLEHEIRPEWCANIGGHGCIRHMTIDEQRECALVFDSRHGDEDFRVHRVSLRCSRILTSQLMRIHPLAMFPPGLVSMCISYVDEPQPMDTFEIRSPVVNISCIGKALVRRPTGELLWTTSSEDLTLLRLHLPPDACPGQPLVPEIVLQCRVRDHCNNLVQSASGEVYVLVRGDATVWRVEWTSNKLVPWEYASIFFLNLLSLRSTSSLCFDPYSDRLYAIVNKPGSRDLVVVRPGSTTIIPLNVTLGEFSQKLLWYDTHTLVVIESCETAWTHFCHHCSFQLITLYFDSDSRSIRATASPSYSYRHPIAWSGVLFRHLFCISQDRRLYGLRELRSVCLADLSSLPVHRPVVLPSVIPEERSSVDPKRRKKIDKRQKIVAARKARKQVTKQRSRNLL